MNQSSVYRRLLAVVAPVLMLVGCGSLHGGDWGRNDTSNELSNYFAPVFFHLDQLVFDDQLGPPTKYAVKICNSIYESYKSNLPRSWNGREIIYLNEHPLEFGGDVYAFVCGCIEPNEDGAPEMIIHEGYLRISQIYHLILSENENQELQVVEAYVGAP